MVVFWKIAKILPATPATLWKSRITSQKKTPKHLNFNISRKEKGLAPIFIGSRKTVHLPVSLDRF